MTKEVGKETGKEVGKEANSSADFGECLRWFVAGITLGFLGTVMGLSYLGLADIGRIAPTQPSVDSEVNRPTSTDVEVPIHYVPVQDKAIIWNVTSRESRVNPATVMRR